MQRVLSYSSSSGSDSCLCGTHVASCSSVSVLTGWEEGHIRLWDARSLKPAASWSHSSASITCVKMDLKQSLRVFAAVGGSIVAWDLRMILEKRPMMEWVCSDEEVNSIDLSWITTTTEEEGKNEWLGCLSADDTGKVILWRVKEAEEDGVGAVPHRSFRGSHTHVYISHFQVIISSHCWHSFDGYLFICSFVHLCDNALHRCIVDRLLVVRCWAGIVGNMLSVED
jgi:hypothetical protein